MPFEIPDRYEVTKMGPMGGQASIVYARDKWLDRPVMLCSSIDHPHISINLYYLYPAAPLLSLTLVGSFTTTPLKKIMTTIT